jgi:ATP-dependent DNA ligase
MEARSVDSLPEGPGWHFEPKWDGFRCILVRKDRDIGMFSKRGEDLTRYFPELVDASRKLKPAQFILDGELVIVQGRSLSFDNLLQRIHPAPSRITKLAKDTPALFVAFDLLAAGRLQFSQRKLPDRREALVHFARQFSHHDHFTLSATTRSLATARRWLKNAGGGFDGVIAKRTDVAYQAGNREGMQKIKHYRSADVVIGGFRYAERPLGGRKVIGSLLLGLYDDEGLLHHVGFTSAIKANDKPALTNRLQAITADKSFTGNTPGGPSRWSTRRSSEWVPLTPELVAEVSYDHFTGGRFRHGTSILRWRPDKSARRCTMEQLQQKTLDVRKLFARSD